MSRRRAVLAGVAALLSAPAATVRAVASPASHPDAELIAVCQAFSTGCRSYHLAYEGPGDEDLVMREVALIVAAWPGQLDRMERLQARTAAGIQARAFALQSHAKPGDVSFDYPETMTGRLLAYLLRDAAALGGAATALRL